MMIWNPPYRTPLSFLLMVVLVCLLVPSVHAQDLQDNRAFVEQQYRDFLGREGDAGGIDFWTGELAAGRTTRAQVADDFFRSAEFQNNIAPVARLYFAYFGRIPDYPGLMYWVGEFQAGGNLNAMSQAFADSAEFRSRYGALNDGAFVDLVYQNVLGRLPDAGGRAFWVSELAAGLSRGAMMIGFSESEEYRQGSFRQVQVTMMYVSMLRRAPDQAGFDYWVSALDAGNSVLGLIGGFLLSDEYASRFLNRHTVTATASTGGSIDPSSQVIPHGDTAVFTLERDPGFGISRVTGCGGARVGDTYTTAPIVEPCVIEAVFGELVYFGTNPINDTGIDWCADGAHNWNLGDAAYKTMQCDAVTNAGFMGQDGHHGRDALARGGELPKIGDGAAGFDYTKIANNGSELPASAMLGSGPDDWACTRDNVTGLIWEVKVDDPNQLRYQGHTYTWYDPSSPEGNPGVQNGGSCIGSTCDTTGFVQAVNAEGLCGASGWRMPTPRELEGIVDYGRNNPAIDTGHFPNTPSSYFWSGSPDAHGSNYAWNVYFNVGYAGNVYRSYDSRVRLVRGGQ